MSKGYPRLEVNIPHLQENVERVCKKCAEFGIEIAGVIKGANGMVEVAHAYDKGGAQIIASSRLEQLEDAKAAGIKKPMMLIRIPMLTEVERTIRIADISLNSEVEVLEKLNEEAKKQGKIHKVILMADLGDLREGFWDKDEMVEVAYWVENDLDNLELLGVGTNVGCYGSISPTVDKLEELVVIAERIEEKIGHKLRYISGGATSSLMRVWDGNIPKRINMLRVGEGIILARDLDVFYGYEMGLHQDIFKLKAEVIEVKDKPSHPQGTIAVDAFGHTPIYIDRGIRRRALLGMGRVDYSDPAELVELEEGIEILGASSDHTIVDIEDAKRDLKVGDIVEYGVCYATVVYLTNSRNVNIVFVE